MALLRARYKLYSKVVFRSMYAYLQRIVTAQRFSISFSVFLSFLFLDEHLALITRYIPGGAALILVFQISHGHISNEVLESDGYLSR